MSGADELLGGEGGTWKLRIRDSHNLLDLDEGTVQRFPGPVSNPCPNDTRRPIRDISVCRVGSHGYWAIWPDDGDPGVEHRWQDTSEIKPIVRMDDDANG